MARRSVNFTFGICMGVALGGLLPGCGDFRPLALDWAKPAPKPASAPPADNRQADAAAAAAVDPAVKHPADAPLADDKLAQKVRQHIERMNQATLTPRTWPRPIDPPVAPGQVISTNNAVQPVARGAESGAERQAALQQPAKIAPAAPLPKEIATEPMAGSPLPPASPPAVADTPGEPARPVVMASRPIIAQAEPAEPAPGGASAAPGPAAGTPQGRPALVKLTGEGGAQSNVTVASATPAAPAAPAALAALRDPAAGELLAETIARAEKLAAGQPADFRLQFQLRMLHLSAGRVREARADWPAGSASERQTLASWIDAAVALGNGAGPAGSADGGESALAAIERLRAGLAERAGLKIRSVRLASRVDGFGIVTPFPTDRYRGGQWIVVYCEIDNLSSRVEADGRHRSELSLRLELLSAEGKSLLQQEDPQVIDRSTTPRRDFFVARRLQLPADLSRGNYVLRASVEDKQAAKVGETMLRFEVN